MEDFGGSSYEDTSRLEDIDQSPFDEGIDYGGTNINPGLQESADTPLNVNSNYYDGVDVVENEQGIPELVETDARGDGILDLGYELGGNDGGDSSQGPDNGTSEQEGGGYGPGDTDDVGGW